MDIAPLVKAVEQKGLVTMRERGTYTDANGIERCAVCHDPVYVLTDDRELIRCLGTNKLPVTCTCDIADAEAFKRRKAAEAARRKARESALYNSHYSKFTFSGDDARDPKASKTCHAYAAHFEELRKENTGLLLSGTVGTGKSFYAACIVNALIAEGIPALMFTATDLGKALQKDGKSVCDALNTFPLLVLDDLGAERETDYAAELLESFIDSRYTAEKPLIVTTNLSAREMQNCEDMRYKRIYDRVKAMCAVPVILTGESRRAEQQRQKAQQAREIMGI